MHLSNVGPKSYRFCPQCGIPNNADPQSATIRFMCPSCGFVAYRNPLPGVSILIENDGEVLLGRRAANSFACESWCLPCGFVEYNEDILAAAAREVVEETGLTVGLQSIIQVTSNFLSPESHTIVTVFLATVKSGTLRPGDDLDIVKWFPLSGPFPQLAFEADKEIITRYSLAPIVGLSLEERPH